MRICFVPGDFSGPGFYRVVFPMREFARNGYQVTVPLYRKVGTGGSREYLMEPLLGAVAERRFDLVVFHNVALKVYFELAQVCRRFGVATVADRDDSEVVPDWHPARVFSEGLFEGETGLLNPGWRRRLFQVVDAASVSTEALADEWRGYSRRVEVLPNVLCWEMWENVVPQYEVKRERLRVGWMGDAKYRLGDLDVLRPWLGDWLRAHPDVDFVAAGSPDAHDILGVPEGQRVSYEQVRFESVASITATMDVGLVPLALGTVDERLFNNGKSHLKGMEYAACGIPCVASPSDPYRGFWLAGERDGRVGLLAGGSADWVRALDLLVTDHAKRKTMGAQAREWASLNTIGEHWTRWLAFYESVVGRVRRLGESRGRMAVPSGAR